MIYRRVHQLLLAIVLATVLMCSLIVIATYMDDRRIDKDMRSTTATVINTSWTTASIRFYDEEGNYHTPTKGVSYPTGLEVDQRILVEYEKSDPNNVRVAGRRWTLSLIPAFSTVLVVSVLVGLFTLCFPRNRQKVKEMKSKFRF